MPAAPGIGTVVGWVVGISVSFLNAGNTCQGLTSDASSGTAVNELQCSWWPPFPAKLMRLGLG